MVKKAVNSSAFNHFITAVILMQAAVLALETFPQLNNHFYFFNLVNTAVLLIFIIEAILKITSTYPNISKYFRDGWNVFDFSIIVLSLLPLGSGYATVARLIRLLRVTRLTNRSQEMAAVVSTIIKSLPSMINIFLLLSLLFFIYGIAGYHLFHTADPVHWGSLPKAILTLFQILTLEGWVEIMSTPAAINPIYGIFFISFIVVGTFIVINIFVAVIVRKSEDAYKLIEGESTGTDTQNEILLEIKKLRKKIEDLEFKLSKE
ncbi:MAG: ion transporter [Thermoproteota archaeon]|nr:ion transporter [Thermoproteota archaeon]